MHVVELIGRIFISLLFLVEGVSKLFIQEDVKMYMESYGVPEILFLPAVIVEILFPILIIAGYKTNFSALVMASFTLAVAIIFHTDFTEGSQLVFFLKDLSIAGAFIILCVYGSNKFSLDYYIKSKKNEV